MPPPRLCQPAHGQSLSSLLSLHVAFLVARPPPKFLSLALSWVQSQVSRHPSNALQTQRASIQQAGSSCLWEQHGASVINGLFKECLPECLRKWALISSLYKETEAGRGSLTHPEWPLYRMAAPMWSTWVLQVQSHYCKLAHRAF